MAKRQTTASVATAISDPTRDRTPHLEIFAERLFANLPTDLDESFPVRQREAIAASAFEFFAVRRAPFAVRVTRNDDGGATVETVTSDRPFIVDSILEYFHKNELSVRVILHPIFDVTRVADGSITAFGVTAGDQAESFTHTELEALPGALDTAAIETGIGETLDDVIAATRDFNAMTTRALELCEKTAPMRELVEIRDFLRWLVQGGFVFLGYRRYRIETHDHRPTLVVEPGSGLGILSAETRSRYAQPVPWDMMNDEHRKLLFEGSPLIVGKTRNESRVHRRAAMDDITIRRVDAAGQPLGLERFVGLFTSKAYAEEAQHIPVLRAKLAEILAGTSYKPGSHDYKKLVEVFNSFPKEELLRARVAEIRAQIQPILDFQAEDGVRLSLHSDPVRGNVIALIIMPRENFSASVRVKLQEALAAHLHGRQLYYYLAMGESYTARLHFSFAAAPPNLASMAAMEADVIRLTRTWDDLLREQLAERFGAAQGNALARNWLPALSPRYRTSTTPDAAVRDIACAERLFAGEAFIVDIRSSDSQSATSELRLYETGAAPALSELVPVLQNFGIAVVSEDAHELRRQDGAATAAVAVQSFIARSLAGESLERLPGFGLVAEALVAVRTGRAEDDPLNALTLRAGLSWREVALVRTYLAAAFQMKLAPARPATRRPFLQYPRLARLLVDYFEGRCNPARTQPTDELGQIKRAYLEQCAAIETIADDRFARAVLAMAEATVRTNYFAPSAASYIALKFESARILNLPDVAPLYEIHVNCPRMEGCHLRGGRIARGGIRYSDRPDDYRTEVLDLMKTQTVKNAIILPVGSKGGFIVKTPPGRAADHDLVVEAYRMLINAMLDLTDNLVDGRVTPPPEVKVLDTDGPYLVVAADKGTSTFSDLANELAERRSFWLGDAFASGGEHGYDHKQMGITARGAWESAIRHLHEMGRNLAHGAPITISGIGDMSGDVFGNGLLRSDNVKLIAAFDHRHIFIDPDPDPQRSFAERQRLYRTPGSQWADYDPALISRGGGVYRRGQKQITLSLEARSALGCEAGELDADSLVQAILRAEVDLLYNGGIGTYVRASSETDAEVGDHANDACRIIAATLRCKVVVEGGNLGFTQKARIEYALAGGRINTDAIDNSAGVDMSDHEVNLKILLAPAVARGSLKPAERNRRLLAAADEVAASVLRDNHDQVLSLSLEQIRSRTQVSMFRDHLTAIEKRAVLHRQEAALPTHEALRERRSRFAGLTRPELAVLTAYTKIDLVAQLEHAPLIDDPYLNGRFLNTYFPQSITSEFAAEIPRHGLRRELATTRVVNEMVDLMGSIFIFNLTRDHAIATATAVRAWLIASDLLELAARAQQLKRDSATLSAQAELSAFLSLEQAARRAAGWSAANQDLAAPIGAAIERFKPGFNALLTGFEETLTAGQRDRFERAYRDLRSVVQEEGIAHELARLAFAEHLLNILSLSFAHQLEPLAVARIYFSLDRKIEFAMIENAIAALGSDDRWERRAARELDNELSVARIRLCASKLAAGANGDAPLDLQVGLEGGRYATEVEQLMADLRALPTLGMPALTVAVRALARLAGGA